MRFPEGRLGPDCRLKIRARVGVFSLEKLYDTQISAGFDVLGIECQNGAEFTECSIELPSLHGLLSFGEVFADLALWSGRGFLCREDE